MHNVYYLNNMKQLHSFSLFFFYRKGEELTTIFKFLRILFGRKWRKLRFFCPSHSLPQKRWEFLLFSSARAADVQRAFQAPAGMPASSDRNSIFQNQREGHDFSSNFFHRSSGCPKGLLGACGDAGLQRSRSNFFDFSWPIRRCRSSSYIIAFFFCFFYWERRYFFYRIQLKPIPITVIIMHNVYYLHNMKQLHSFSLFSLKEKGRKWPPFSKNTTYNLEILFMFNRMFHIPSES